MSDRQRFVEFMASDAPEVEQVNTAVDATLEEYRGYISRVDKAATSSEEQDLDPGEIRDGITRMAGFAVWKALISDEKGKK